MHMDNRQAGAACVHARLKPGCMISTKTRTEQTRSYMNQSDKKASGPTMATYVNQNRDDIKTHIYV